MCGGNCEEVRDCPMLPDETKGQGGLPPYEFHITVPNKYLNDRRFEITCGSMGAKHVYLHDYIDGLSSGNHKVEVMTSKVSRHSAASVLSAVAELQEQVKYLKSFGFEIIRAKIETAPWHKKVPSQANGIFAMPKCKVPDVAYFECHLPIIVSTDMTGKADEIAKEYGVYFSRNLLKPHKLMLMATIRSYADTYELFQVRAWELQRAFALEGFQPGPCIIEYAFYDTNPELDADWIKEASRWQNSNSMNDPAVLVEQSAA